MTRPYSRPSLQCSSYHPQCLHLPECEKARGRWRTKQKYSNDNFWYKKKKNVNFHNLTFFILLLCFRLNRPGIFLLSDECNAGKRFGCAKYPLCMPLVKIIIRTNNISEVNRDFLAYVVCHSVKWVPNLWELSQLGKNFLSWPPAVGKKHYRPNDDKTNSLWFAEPRKRNSF